MPSLLARSGVAAGLLAATAYACAADLTVTVNHVAGATGNVRVAVYNQAESFPKTIFQGLEVPAAAGTVQVVFKGLPAGDYAVSAFQDLNGNKKLDTNGLGIPIEPYGFSRGARGSNGPPVFADASFHLGEPARTESVNLK
jgi:uncharacterized protein (DUF2141 family)